MREPTRAQTATSWIVVCALAASLTADILAWAQARKRSRNWDKAIAEDLQKATADANTET